MSTKKPHWNQTLTDAQVRDVREMIRKQTATSEEIIKTYGIGRVHLNAILRGATRLQAGGPIPLGDGTYKVLEPGFQGSMEGLKGLATSSTSLKRARGLEKLSAAAQLAFSNEEISRSTAYELGKLSKDQQDQVLESAKTMTRDEFRRLVHQIRESLTQALFSVPVAGENVVFPRPEEKTTEREKDLILRKSMDKGNDRKEYRTRVTTNPDRFVPKEVVTTETRRDIGYYLRLLVTEVGMFDALRGKPLDQVVTHLNKIRETELQRLIGTSFHSSVAAIKPYPKRHQYLLRQVIYKAYGLVINGPLRNQVFMTEEDIQEQKQAKKQALVARKEPLEAALQDLGQSALLQLQKQIGELNASVVMCDPGKRVDEILNLLRTPDKRVEQILGLLREAENASTARYKALTDEIATRDQALATALQTLTQNLQRLATDMAVHTKFLAEIKVTGDACAEILGPIQNWVDAQRSRQAAELKSKSSPGVIPTGV